MYSLHMSTIFVKLRLHFVLSPRVNTNRFRCKSEVESICGAIFDANYLNS
jgi:hypothetical protein